MVVRVPELVGHVLANPTAYPGCHTQAQERTSKGLQKLDPHRQLTLIWDALCARLKELLLAGDSVNVPHFGIFSFQNAITQVPYGPSKIVRTPCFVPCGELKTALPSYHGKEAVDLDQGAISTAQAVPSKLKFLNEVPIASGCYYRVDVVRSGMKQLFKGLGDLAARDYEMEINMGFAKFWIAKRTVKVSWAPEFMEEAMQPTKLSGAASAGQGGETLAETWKKPDFSKSMAQFIERPNSAETHGKRIATANIDVMSRDLTSCK